MRRALPHSIALALLLTAAPAAAAPAGQPAATLLHCGGLFDADSAKLLGPHTLVIREGRIAEVLPGDRVPEGWAADTEATTTDLRDHTCLPGLIDSHVHLDGETSKDAYSEGFRLDPEDEAFRAVGYAERTLLAGFTTVRDLGGTVTLALRDAIAQGLVRGPRIVAAGKSIATTGGHADPTNGVNREIGHALGHPGPEEGVVNSVDDARQAVRQRYKEGSDLIKITATGGVLSFAKSGDNPQFTVAEIEEIVRTAHDYGFKVAAHAHGKEGMKRAVEGGVDSIEHGTYMDDEVMALMKEHGTWYVPTITAGNYVSEKSKEPGYYPEVVRPKAARIGPLIKATAGRAYAAGVKIAFGTDAGVYPHGQNGREFALMVDTGMPPAFALQSATRNAAQLLGEWEQVGSLSAGKRADVVAVRGNPLEDIALLEDVAFVMKDGVVYKGAAAGMD